MCNIHNDVYNKGYMCTVGVMYLYFLFEVTELLWCGGGCGGCCVVSDPLLEMS